MATLYSSPSTSSALLSRANSFQKIENQLGIPPLLRPLLRAYILGYASSTGPRILSLILRHLDRDRKRVKIGNGDGQSKHVFFNSFLGILRGGLELQRFPTSCAVVAGGSTLLHIPIRRLLERLMKTLSSTAKARLAQSIATFISAYLALDLLQSKRTPEYVNLVPPNTYCKKTGKALKSTEYAGRTLDLTLFAFTRALDIVVGSVWQSYTSSSPKTSITKKISYLTDPILFAGSSALIMWSYFYFPDRLPRNYLNWITTAANVDPRLVTALRLCHQGNLVYGQSYPPNSPGRILQDMCKDYGWPEEWGDTAKNIPFPCTMVHMRDGPICEIHALSRLVRSFKWALSCNLPLNLVLMLKNPSKRGFQRAVISSVRSSGFLAAFIALFYYGVCLCRRRCQQFGPTRRALQRLLGIKEPRDHPDFQMIEGEEDGMVEIGDGIVEIEISKKSLPSILEIDPNEILTLLSPSPSISNESYATPPSTPPLPPTTTDITPLKLSIQQQTAQAIDSGLCILSGCLLCGWSILLENAKGGRRGELTLFVVPRALRTLWNKRYGKDREWIERVVFAGSAVVVVEGVRGMSVLGSGGRGRLRAPRGVFGKLVGAVLL